MSIALMTAVWKLDLSPSDKMVLLALADAANDDGVTWMALESKEGVKLDLLKKTSLSRRAVQGALKRLCDAGYLSRVDRPGKGVIWTVKGCTSCAPQEMRPAADAPRGAADAPKPSINPQPTSEAIASSVAREAARTPRASKRCPESWEPSVDDCEAGVEKGLSLTEVAEELVVFRDHTFATARTDWSATFRNWLRKAAKLKAKSAPRGTHDRPDPHRSAKLEHLDGIARAMAASRHGAVSPGGGDRPDPGAEGGGRAMLPAA